MFEKLYKKYGLSMNSDNLKNPIKYYNENGVEFYVEDDNPNLSKINNIYIKNDINKRNSNQVMFFDYLVNKKSNIKDFNFFILSINSNKSEIKEMINEIIYKAIILEYEEYLVVIYDVSDIDPIILSNSLKEDFYLNVKVFRGLKLNNLEDLFYMFILYRYYLKDKDVSSVRDLILITLQHNVKEIIKLKSVILKELKNDSQMEKLINGMFNNNLNVSKTSSEVYMHRNTINNKLDVIKEETSLDIQNFKDAMAMYFLINAK